MIHVIFAAVSALAGATGTYVFLDARHERELSDIRSAQATALAKANADALAETQRLQEAADKARKAADARQSALARDLAAARSTVGGLRDELSAASLQLPSASCSAAREYARAASIVVGECSARLVEVAEHADRATGEVILLRESWPAR